MTRSSFKTIEVIGENVQELIEEAAIAKDKAREAKAEVEVLKRELGHWQRRAERAEQEKLRWEATANAWRLEFMKQARR